MSTNPLNPETLLGEKPMGLAPEFQTRRAAEAALTMKGRDRYYIAGGIDKPFRIRPLSDLSAEEQALMATPTMVVHFDPIANETKVYEGGPDGPIREPGDDVPSRSDIYTDAELCASLDLHRARLVKLGLYNVAADLDLARDALEERAEEVERLAKQVQNLAAEKRQAQEWIANLRHTNELYSRTIAEQNTRLAECDK